MPAVLLDTAQAATYLGLSVATLQDWRWKRQGPPFARISRGCIRYDQAALDRWVESKTVIEIPRSA